jgi:CheY-like chemotaxis protein
MKILVVNDCKFEREVFKNILTNLDNVNQVTTTEETQVQQMIETIQPDIIIVNLIMEQATGDKLIEAIKSNYSKLNTTCILSSSNPIKLEDYEDKQVDAVFQTPIEEDRLKNLLARFNLVKQENNKAKFCPHCGQGLDTEKQFTFCPYCGEEV